MLVIREEYEDKNTVVYNIGLNINQEPQKLYTKDGGTLILEYKAYTVGKNLIVEIYNINETYFEDNNINLGIAATLTEIKGNTFWWWWILIIAAAVLVGTAAAVYFLSKQKRVASR